MHPIFHFWWNNTLDKAESKSPGFQLRWHIENRSLPDVKQFVSKELSGSVSTPGLGSLPSPNYYKERHEYTAVIELPHNISDILSDSSLLVDIDVMIPDSQLDTRLELETAELVLEYNPKKMTWDKAEELCMSKGGHLASASSQVHWETQESFLRENGISEPIWIGGRYRDINLEWTWTDKTRWIEEHWSLSCPWIAPMYDDRFFLGGKCLS